MQLKMGNKGEPGFSEKTITGFVMFIIGIVIALYVFAQLAPGISAILVPGNFSTNPMASALVTLIMGVFVVVIIIAILKFVGKI